MNKNARAITMVLLMMASALAGCTGGDPDGDDIDEFDAETLSNLQNFFNGTMESEWIQDRGDSGHQWTLSLNDDQWLEVKSAVTVINYNGNDASVTSSVRSEDGFAVALGFSPIFGGNYSWCSMNYDWDLPCANEDPDGRWVVVEWSIIYRIHEVSPPNYYFTGSEPSEPALLEHQNITLNVSYVPSGSNESGRVYGNIVVELFTNDAPMHVESFVSHIESEAYNHTIFHRVIDGFMIQGGDIDNRGGSGGYAANFYGYCNGQGYMYSTCGGAGQDAWTIPDEADNGLLHSPGALAMAKTSADNTGGSQFYIVPSDSTPSHLDGIHTVFGMVVSGQDVVDAISEVDTPNSTPQNDGSGDTPIYDVIIEEAWLD